MKYLGHLFLLLACYLWGGANAQRFVRFISDDGKEYYGDAILQQGSTDAAKSTRARVIRGDILADDFEITDHVKVRGLHI